MLEELVRTGTRKEDGHENCVFRTHAAEHEQIRAHRVQSYDWRVTCHTIEYVTGELT